MLYFEDRGDHLILNNRAVSRSADDSFQGLMDDVLKVRTQAEEGKANINFQALDT